MEEEEKRERNSFVIKFRSVSTAVFPSLHPRPYTVSHSLNNNHTNNNNVVISHFRTLTTRRRRKGGWRATMVYEFLPNTIYATRRRIASFHDGAAVMRNSYIENRCVRNA